MKKCPYCGYLMSDIHLLQCHIPCPRCEKGSTENFMDVKEEKIDFVPMDNLEKFMKERK